MDKADLDCEAIEAVEVVFTCSFVLAPISLLQSFQLYRYIDSGNINRLNPFER
jgi:hypothetical protein